MKSHGLLQYGRHAGWRVLFDYGTAQSFVNGTTTLFSYTSYGDDFSEFALFVEDQDGAVEVDCVLSVSHGGVRECLSLRGQDHVPAGGEGCARVDYDGPGTYVRGQVVNAGAPVVGRWALIGKPRYNT